MKKHYLVFGSIVLISIFFIFVIYPVSVNCQKEKKEKIVNSIPDSLSKIFSNSCMPCHFDGGSKMAIFALNFSDWNKYSVEKQFKKGESICKKITDGTMPPKSFRESKPGIVPTKAQVNNICKWTGTLKNK